MIKFIDSNEAALRLGVTRRHIRRMRKAGKFAGAVKVNGRWQIPVNSHPQLAGLGAGDLGNCPELPDVSLGKKQRALWKLGHIRAFEKFASTYVRTGGRRSDSYGLYAARCEGVNARSIRRWIKKYRIEGLQGLVDSRGGKFRSLIISPEAFEYFKGFYLTQQKLSIKQCWLNTCFINKDQQKGWKVPSLSSMHRYVERQIPLYVRVLHREGLAAFQAKCAPYIESDPDSVRPGAIWVGDHHQFNCWIRYRGRWIRPWLTAWADYRSRNIVGWHISSSPNQTTILQSFKRAVEKHGPPDTVKIDNGRDYDSEMWTGTTKVKRKAAKAGYLDEQMVAGLYAMMGIGISFAIPYHPQSKPIERLFDTIDCQFTKTINTYCGKDTNRKPEYLNDLLSSEKAIESAHDIKSFAAKFAEYVKVYNNTAHSGRGMDGRSPAEVLATRQSLRVLAEGVLDLIARVWSRELVVGKNGVKFNKMWYGQGDLELMAYQGKKVRVAYDPDDLRRVHVYNAATMKLITIAEQARLVRYGRAVDEDSLREASRQKARAVKAAKAFKDSRLTANMDLTDLTIRAMADAAKKPPKEMDSARKLKPVVTILNSQVEAHQRLELKKLVKKAAGAETVREVLNIDLAAMKPQRKTNKLKLFDEG